MTHTYFTKPLEVETEVLRTWEKDGKHYVELSSNPFYADGYGGQIGDRGFVGQARVLFVEDDRVEVDRPLKKGIFLAKADLDRRKEIARQHTAQHIISAVAEKKFGAKTVGFHMGEDFTTVDFDSDVEIEKLVEVSNEIVLSDLEVEEIVTTADEVGVYKLRKLSEKALKAEKIRIIKIGNLDLNACGGFHVSKTGEIGSIRIVHSERVKGGTIRIWFVAGKRALKDCLEKEKILKESSKLFDASWKDLKDRVEKVLLDAKEKNSKIKKLSQMLATYISKEIRENEVLEVDENVASFISRSKQDVAYLLKISQNVATICVPSRAKEEVMKWAKDKGFKGGGKGPIYRFTFDDFSDFKDSFLLLTQAKK